MKKPAKRATSQDAIEDLPQTKQSRKVLTLTDDAIEQGI